MSAWGIWERVGPRRFRTTIRVWTYDAHANPTLFQAGDFDISLSSDGNSFKGKGPLQFFDNNGNAVGLPTPLLLNAARIKIPTGKAG